MGFIILTDSACDLDRSMRQRYNVAEYFSGYMVDGDTRRKHDLDWENMTPDQFYGSMTKNHMYTSAITNAEELRGFFGKYLAEGNDVLYLGLSSALSGTFALVSKVREELLETYPERKFICVDTLRYSGALALLISLADEKRASGASIEETASYIEDQKTKIHECGTVDDLFFLSKQGRVSNLAAFMGSLIALKPIAEFDKQGSNYILGKVKGYNAMYKTVIGYMKETIEDPHESTIFISCSNRKAQAEKLRELVMEEFAPREIVMTTLCQACGGAIGPGFVAVFYRGKRLSDDLSREQEIFNRVAAK